MLRTFIDQYGQTFHAKTIKDLAKQVGGRYSRMYIDKKTGDSAETYHIGYVVGKHWFTEYTPVMRVDYIMGKHWLTEYAPVMRVGYVEGKHWCTEYAPVMRKA